MRVWVERLGVPLVGGVAEHKTLVARTELTLSFVPVHRRGDICILSMNVRDDLAIGTVEANFLTSVADLPADITSDLLEVHLISGDVCLTKQYDLNKEKG